MNDAVTSSANQLRQATHEASMDTKTIKVLTVDDEIDNLEILDKHLSKAGYEVTTMTSGDAAWQLLQDPKSYFDIILLDRMMPGLDGMEILKRLKQDSRWSHTPVIFQTAMIGDKQTTEGIKAGAYYYISKPFSVDMLLSVMASAARESQLINRLESSASKRNNWYHYMQSGTFSYRTIEEARELADYISSTAVTPSKVIMALTALMINAVEHGNLEVGYNLKRDLLLKNRWAEEIGRRLEAPQYKDRIVVLDYKREGHFATVTITDQGSGFEFKRYLDFDPTRMADSNGRGIALANMTGESPLQYHDGGNKVSYRFSI